MFLVVLFSRSWGCLTPCYDLFPIAHSGAADPHPYLRSSAGAAPAPGPAEPQHWTSGVSTARPLQLLLTALQVLQTAFNSAEILYAICHISIYLPHALFPSQVSAGIHAEQPLPDVSNDAIWDATAQLPWSAAPRFGEASVQSSLPADLKHPTHPHPVWAPDESALWYGRITADRHTPTAGQNLIPAACGLLCFPPFHFFSLPLSKLCFFVCVLICSVREWVSTQTCTLDKSSSRAATTAQHKVPALPYSRWPFLCQVHSCLCPTLALVVVSHSWLCLSLFLQPLPKPRLPASTASPPAIRPTVALLARIHTVWCSLPIRFVQKCPFPDRHDVYLTLKIKSKK